MNHVCSYREYLYMHVSEKTIDTAQFQRHVWIFLYRSRVGVAKTRDDDCEASS